MIAPRNICPEYLAWNRRWGAPAGHQGYSGILRGTRFDARRRGPFGSQENNSIRLFEYPWAYDQISRRGSSLTVVDIGGSLAGMQFVLAKEGHRVVNVDPGMKAGGVGWEVDAKTHNWLCKRLRAQVELVPETLENAGLADEFADVILCISSLEHFSDADIAGTAKTIKRILKPNGVVVFTVDCFLDLAPFTDRASNKWGRNISIKDFLDAAALTIVEGRREELLGFPEFCPRQIMSRLPSYLVGEGYPCLAQCFVARRAAAAGA